jgi:acyl-CoA synthetase (AMP-forming)/AMP-acid ligase II
MVVPTMLARIVDQLDGAPAGIDSLRSMSYGGAKVSERVLVAALEAFPTTGFVNAYGLTETASTIAVLGPDDHRDALSSDDPAVRRRLSSAGRLLPTVEIEIRDEFDVAAAEGEVGMIYLRGEQVSGEYSTGSVLDADGWFCTRDRGFVDVEGYLFIEGRVDDTIIRGGENIAPAEIEEVLYRDPDVAEACVVGVPDDEWGQRIIAVVVRKNGTTDAESLRNLVRSTLRGSKTPDEIVFRDVLPHTETGKLLRRIVLQDLKDAGA